MKVKILLRLCRIKTSVFLMDLLIFYLFSWVSSLATMHSKIVPAWCLCVIYLRAMHVGRIYQTGEVLKAEVVVESWESTDFFRKIA